MEDDRVVIFFCFDWKLKGEIDVGSEVGIDLVMSCR